MSSQTTSQESSEACSLSTNHSYNPYFFQNGGGGGMFSRVLIKPAFVDHRIDITPNNKSKNRDECLLNCLKLNPKPSGGESSEEPYFEYDAFKMGGHAEFIFKKVNLNKKYDPGESEMVGKIDKNDPAQQTQTSMVFETKDLDRLKTLLNWTPTYGHYDDVFDEFEKFVSRKHVCNKCEHHIGSELKNHITKCTNSNQILSPAQFTPSSHHFYDEFNKHTFV